MERIYVDGGVPMRKGTPRLHANRIEDIFLPLWI